jgi:DNA helicase-2/ATP-dependent DNA helicase PcrA
MLNAMDSRDQLLKIDKLFDEVKRQVKSNSNYSLSNFITFVDAYHKYNLDIETNNPEIIEGVKLMTAHKSKGLEFEYVYMINATRKNWEKSKGFNKISLPIKDYKGDIDDERRLFYVAMTRAKDGLFISSSITDWEGKDQEKSQFVSEINEEFLEYVDVNNFEIENINNLSLFIQSHKKEKSFWDK